MTAIELRAKKMEIIEMLMNVDDERVVAKIMSAIRETKADNPPCRFTVNEVKQRIAEAEDDIRSGVPGIPHQEAMKQIKERVALWK